VRGGWDISAQDCVNASAISSSSRAQSVISRLEDDDYAGQWLTMLDRITAALQKRLILSVVDIKS